MKTLRVIARDSLARLFRRTPTFRGESRLVSFLQGMLTDYHSDEECICVAPMRDGSLLKLDLRSKLERHAYWRREYDSAKINRFSQHFPADAVVIDVGANIGFYTIVIARRLSQGRVYAFEPVPANHERLIENIEINMLSNVTAINAAVGAYTYKSYAALAS